MTGVCIALIGALLQMPQVHRSSALPQKQESCIYFEFALSVKPGAPKPSSLPPDAPAGAMSAPPAHLMGGAGSITARGWRSGSKTRLEMKKSVGTEISISNSTGIYRLQPTLKSAIRSLPAGHTAHAGEVRFSLMDPVNHFDPKTQLLRAKQIGKETVCGIECEIWQGDMLIAPMAIGHSPGQSRKMKVWIPKNGRPSFPLRLEAEGAAPNGGTVLAQFTRIRFLDRLPASLFVVPPTYKIRTAVPSFLPSKRSEDVRKQPK